MANKAQYRVVAIRRQTSKQTKVLVVERVKKPIKPTSDEES